MALARRMSRITPAKAAMALMLQVTRVALHLPPLAQAVPVVH